MSLTDAQLARRRTGISASEAGVVSGLSTYVDPMMLYMLKRGLLERPQTPEQRLGHLLEPVVDALYRDRNPGTNTFGGDVTLRHPAIDWALATPDRFCAVGRPGSLSADEQGRLVACDADHIAQYKSARRHEAHEWGPEGTDEVPLGYFAQVQWEMAVTGMRRCDLAVLVAGSEFVVYRIAFNEEVFGALLEVNARFWHDHVLAGVPPAFDGREGSDLYLRHAFPSERRGEVLKADATCQQIAERLRVLRAESKATDAEKSLLEQRLCSMMGEAEAIAGDTFRFTWRKQAGRVAWKGACQDALDLGERARAQLAAGQAQAAQETLAGLDGLRERSTSAPQRVFRATYKGEPEEP